MATIVIDKKKQFQIQTVQSKLDNYKQTLTTLLESHKQLSNNLELNNPNYDNLDKLNSNKIVLENTLKELKKNIAKTTNNITKLSYSLKELPSIRINKYNEEELILKLNNKPNEDGDEEYEYTSGDVIDICRKLYCDELASVFFAKEAPLS